MEFEMCEKWFLMRWCEYIYGVLKEYYGGLVNNQKSKDVRARAYYSGYSYINLMDNVYYFYFV